MDHLNPGSETLLAALLTASLLLLPAVPSYAGNPASGEFPQDVLTEVLKKQKEIAFIGERTQTTISGSTERRKRTYRQRVLHIPPVEYRIDFLDLPDDRELHLLVQGEHMFEWRKEETVYVSERAENQTLGLVISETYLELLRKNYSIEAGKGMEVAGRSTYAVRIDPHYPGRPSIRAWIDSTYGVPLKLEVYDHDGLLEQRYEYNRIRFARRLRVETFSLPDGAVIRHQSSGTECTTPDELFEETGKLAPLADRLPAGFTLTKVRFGSRREREYLQSFYSDGYASFSIFAMKNPREAPRGRSKPGLRSVSSGVRRDYHYATGWVGETQITVMGNIAESELLDVLSSVRLRDKSLLPESW